MLLLTERVKNKFIQEIMKITYNAIIRYNLQFSDGCANPDPILRALIPDQYQFEIGQIRIILLPLRTKLNCLYGLNIDFRNILYN